MSSRKRTKKTKQIRPAGGVLQGAFHRLGKEAGMLAVHVLMRKMWDVISEWMG